MEKAADYDPENLIVRNARDLVAEITEQESALAELRLAMADAKNHDSWSATEKRDGLLRLLDAVERNTNAAEQIFGAADPDQKEHAEVEAAMTMCGMLEVEIKWQEQFAIALEGNLNGLLKLAMEKAGVSMPITKLKNKPTSLPADYLPMVSLPLLLTIKPWCSGILILAKPLLIGPPPMK